MQQEVKDTTKNIVPHDDNVVDQEEERYQQFRQEIEDLKLRVALIEVGLDTIRGVRDDRYD